MPPFMPVVRSEFTAKTELYINNLWQEKFARFIAIDTVWHNQSMAMLASLHKVTYKIPLVVVTSILRTMLRTSRAAAEAQLCF